jgi:hypothetical protein
MSERERSPQRLWGRQEPFERNYFQRILTLTGLGAVFAVSVILLVAENVYSVLGIALVFAGMMAGLAALSRWRYVQESRTGFTITRIRGGWFVVESALALVLLAFLVAVIILR